MSDAVFLDSTILVYAALQPDGRSDKARALLAKRGTISVQVLNEFANVACRQLRQPWPDIMQALSAICVLYPAPVPLTVATHETAVMLAARYGFALNDAMIVASALEAGCSTLLAEDMQDGLVVEARLTIRNPFLQPATPPH